MNKCVMCLVMCWEENKARKGAGNEEGVILYSLLQDDAFEQVPKLWKEEAIQADPGGRVLQRAASAVT